MEESTEAARSKISEEESPVRKGRLESPEGVGLRAALGSSAATVERNQMEDLSVGTTGQAAPSQTSRYQITELLKVLESRVDDNIYRVVAEEAASLVFEGDGSSTPEEGRSASNSNDSSPEGSSKPRPATIDKQTSTDAGVSSSSIPTGADISIEDAEVVTQLREKLVELETAVESERTEKLNLMGRIDGLNMQLSERNEQAKWNATREEEAAADTLDRENEELAEARHKLVEAEAQQEQLLTRIKELEEEASVFGKDVLASDTNTRRAARLIDDEPEATVDEASFSFSRSSREPVATFGLQDGDAQRNQALLEAANVVLQRDLRLKQVTCDELKAKVTQSEKTQGELQELIASLRHTLALTEMRCAEASRESDKVAARNTELEAAVATLATEKETSEAQRLTLQTKLNSVQLELKVAQEVIEESQRYKEERSALETENRRLATSERELRAQVSHQLSALKELDFERTKLKEYLVRYESELKRTEDKVSQLKKEFKGYEVRTRYSFKGEDTRSRRSHVVGNSGTPEEGLRRVMEERDRLLEENAERQKEATSLDATVQVLRREAVQSEKNMAALRAQLRRAEDENLRLRVDEKIGASNAFSVLHGLSSTRPPIRS